MKGLHVVFVFIKLLVLLAPALSATVAHSEHSTSSTTVETKTVIQSQAVTSYIDKTFRNVKSGSSPESNNRLKKAIHELVQEKSDIFTQILHREEYYQYFVKIFKYQGEKNEEALKTFLYTKTQDEGKVRKFALAMKQIAKNNHSHKPLPDYARKFWPWYAVKVFAHWKSSKSGSHMVQARLRKLFGLPARDSTYLKQVLHNEKYAEYIATTTGYQGDFRNTEQLHQHAMHLVETNPRLIGCSIKYVALNQENPRNALKLSRVAAEKYKIQTTLSETVTHVDINAKIRRSVRVQQQSHTETHQHSSHQQSHHQSHQHSHQQSHQHTQHQQSHHQQSHTSVFQTERSNIQNYFGQHIGKAASDSEDKEGVYKNIVEFKDHHKAWLVGILQQPQYYNYVKECINYKEQQNVHNQAELLANYWINHYYTKESSVYTSSILKTIYKHMNDQSTVLKRETSRYVNSHYSKYITTSSSSTTHHSVTQRSTSHHESSSGHSHSYKEHVDYLKAFAEAGSDSDADVKTNMHQSIVELQSKKDFLLNVLKQKEYYDYVSACLGVQGKHISSEQLYQVWSEHFFDQKNSQYTAVMLKNIYNHINGQKTVLKPTRYITAYQQHESYQHTVQTVTQTVTTSSSSSSSHVEHSASH